MSRRHLPKGLGVGAAGIEMGELFLAGDTVQILLALEADLKFTH